MNSLTEIRLQVRRIEKEAKSRQNAVNFNQAVADGLIKGLEDSVVVLTTENVALKERVLTLEDDREAP